MKNQRTPKIFALLSVIGGGAIALSWIFNIFPIIRSFSPNWASMVFFTAVCFLLSGIALYLAQNKSKTAKTTIIAIALFVITIMITFWTADVLNIKLGISHWFITRAEVKITTPGFPSLATMFNFILLSIAGIFSALDQKLEIEILGTVVAALGGLGVLGYILGVPELYFEVPLLSTGMAFPTALLFFILGIGWFTFASQK